jgi:hypothetical protein
MLECETPDLRGDNTRPHLHGVKHGAGWSCNHPNVPFDATILPMSADSTERLPLVTGIKMVSKEFVGKDPVVM